MSDELMKRLLEPSFDTFFGPVVEPIKMKAAARIEELEKALREARANLLDLAHARWSEFEGSDEELVG